MLATHPTIRAMLPLLRPLSVKRALLQCRIPCPPLPSSSLLATRSYASSSNSSQITDKSRILEKPERFNPPSHGSRRPRPRQYPAFRASDEEREAQRKRWYPNMMPPEGTLMHWFLTNRAIHAWITLSVLLALAVYSLSLSFISRTPFRQQLPSSSDFFSAPLQTISQFISVYKLHVAWESEQVTIKRQAKIADAKKRQEFLREHGVEPAFLTGTWMDKFGTVEMDRAREAAAKAAAQVEGSKADEGSGAGQEQPREPRKKPKMWFGIW